ncbi:helix-turn-helix domain-containing protein [Streptomyces sp. NPDC051913]|uniref:nSTAND1 domain-containing NTPase n=1 Tax=Streptomyces sp. NPDC051913 TaxID=3365676 RepID=UPI0037D4224B
MAGRRELPVDPAAGPVQRFACALRELRAAADGMTYRSLARRAGYSVSTLSQAAAGERLPTLPVALAYARACGGDLAQWEARWKEAAEGAAGDDDGSFPPYRGLARFETADSDLFFGRDRLTADLVDLLRGRRFAAVFGPSGSGKSSLLRAGLIPVLRTTREPGLRPAAIRILTPGEHPLRSHASLLEPAPAEADTFVIVDQFEEVFTLCQDPAERARFIDLLLTARQPAARLRVLLAVRGDFYGRCAEHRELADALRDANLLAGALSPAELRDTVVKPATAAGLTVERALTARLVKEVADAPGGLPLLSHALLETWRRRRGKTLTVAGYEAAGCLDGAIATTAEQIYDGFTDDQATAARRVLLRLVAPGDGTPDTRRPVRRAELPGTGRDGTAAVVDALARARLLTLDDDTVEMAHEALITSWPRLRGWIDADRERLRAHRKLTEAAHTWRELGREKGALYRGSRLTAVQEYFGGAPRGELTELERDFLDASRDDARRGRRRYRLVLTGVTTALCLALVAAGLAVGQWRSAITAQHTAQSRQLAAQSRALLDSDPDLAALLAVHAYRTSPTREAAGALYAAAASPLRERLADGTAPVESLALTPDGHTLATHSTDGTARIWDLSTGRLRKAFTASADDEDSQVAALSPDGRTLAVATTGDTGAAVTLWDPATGKKLSTFPIPDGAVRALAFSPDGRSVAASSPAAVRVWDVSTGRTRHRFSGHPDPHGVAFGPDGRTVAAVGPGGQVRVWELATGRTRTSRDSLIGGGGAVALSPDGRTCAIAGTDGSVQLRETATGAVRRTIRDVPVALNGLRFSGDGRTLALSGSGDTVRLWDTVSGTAIGTVTAGHHGRGAVTVALDVDGRTLVTSSTTDAAARVHGLSVDRPRITLPGPTGTHLTDLTFSRDGSLVSAVGQGPPGGGAVRLWDARTGDAEATLASAPEAAPEFSGRRLPFVSSRLAAVGFSPAGRALVARAGKGEVIEVRDLATGRLHRSRAVDAAGPAVLSPDGTRLAFAGARGAVRIWQLSTGAVRTVHAGGGELVRGLVFAPDGRTLAVVGIEGDGDRVTLLDPATGRTVRTLRPGIRSPLSLAFSPDGRSLATVGTTNGQVRTWDVRTGDLLADFGVGEGVTSPAYSPDGRALAMGTVSGVQLWDLGTTQKRGTLPTRSPTAMAFSPDGRTLAIATGSSVGLWTVDLPDPAEAIRALCETVGRSLTAVERSRHPDAGAAESGCPARAT